jgi:Flp pilus assembly protein protease CpaA
MSLLSSCNFFSISTGGNAYFNFIALSIIFLLFRFKLGFIWKFGSKYYFEFRDDSKCDFRGDCRSNFELSLANNSHFTLHLVTYFITIPFILLGLGFNSFGLFQSFENALLGAIAGFASLWAILYLYKFLTKKAGMGFGDLKMLAMLGAWLGWQVIPFIILFSSLLGATFGIILIILGRANRDSPLPFGAFLALGGYGALFIMPGFFHT